MGFCIVRCRHLDWLISVGVGRIVRVTVGVEIGGGGIGRYVLGFALMSPENEKHSNPSSGEHRQSSYHTACNHPGVVAGSRSRDGCSTGCFTWMAGRGCRSEAGCYWNLDMLAERVWVLT
jgi:hypothetical protein